MTVIYEEVGRAESRDGVRAEEGRFLSIAPLLVSYLPGLTRDALAPKSEPSQMQAAARCSVRAAKSRRAVGEEETAAGGLPAL